MNGNDFLNAMTDVDDKYITEAEKKPKRRGLFIGAMSVAAAAVITVTAVSVNTRFGNNHAYTSNPTNGNNQAGIGGAVDSDTNSSVDISGIIDDPSNESNQSGASNGVSVIREPQNDIVFPTAPSVPSTSAEGGELPKLSPEYQFAPAGMGGGGYDEVKLDEANPWNPDMTFETLPVYRSFPLKSDHDYMMETLRCVVETLGYDFSKMIVTDSFMTEEREQSLREEYEGYGAPEKEIERIIRTSKFGSQISAGNAEVSVSINMRYEVTIWWRDGYEFKLPEGSSLESAGEYVLNTVGNMFRLNSPVVSVNSEYEYIELYDDGTDAEKFVNYQMNKVDINVIKGWVVIFMRFNAPGGQEKIGDYPIISLDKAKERLYNNIYTTIQAKNDYTFQGTEPIGGVDLVYLTRSFLGYDMPYYRFYAKTDNGFGEEVYFDYYVPAIADEYLLLDSTE